MWLCNQCFCGHRLHVISATSFCAIQCEMTDVSPVCLQTDVVPEVWRRPWGQTFVPSTRHWPWTGTDYILLSTYSMTLTHPDTFSSCEIKVHHHNNTLIRLLNLALRSNQHHYSIQDPDTIASISTVTTHFQVKRDSVLSPGFSGSSIHPAR